MNIGLCENNVNCMETGGLIPKGTKCHNRAAYVVDYFQWEGDRPCTMKLCAECKDSVIKMASRYKRVGSPGRSRMLTTTQYSGEFKWSHKVVVNPAEKITQEQIQRLKGRYVALPKALG